ncbi:MAG: hypothetical protein ACUVQG_14390 [Thermogutta sp.]
MKTAGKAIFLLAVAAICLSGNAQADEAMRNAPIRDAQGREIIPGDSVTTTEDRLVLCHRCCDA